MILDVGCGINPKGDVNVDLKMGANYGITRTKANLYASVYNLPFKDQSFNTTYANGLLHHLQYPKKAWKEILRVTGSIVICVEPNWNLFLPRDKTEYYHLYKKRMIESITQSNQFNIIVRRIINTVRIGRVNPVDRTWNVFPIMLNFLIIGVRNE